MVLLSAFTTKSNAGIFVLIFTIMFTVFALSSDGHRYTSDEDFAHLQTIRMVTLEPHPLYVDGESKKLFEHPTIYPPQFNKGNPCTNFIICSPVSVATSLTQYPFVFLNHHLKIITENTVQFTIDDFPDQHYVFWRNSQNPDFTFLELFYGPFFASLSVSVFFLICNLFSYKLKISLFLTFLFGLSTPLWAYSQTSLNVIPTLFFLILSFYFFIRYQKTHSVLFLIFCSLSLGFSYLIREDIALVIVPLIIYFLISLRNTNQKLKSSLCFFSSLIPFYFIGVMFDYLRYGFSVSETSSATISSFSNYTSNTLAVGISGMLFSPGVGLFIFAPVLLTIFFSLPDFYRRNKGLALFFLGTICLFLIYFGSIQFWHGLVSWSERYLLIMIPFFLLPLGSSLISRTSVMLRGIILSLGSLGFLFNLAYVLQDVSWFIWGSPGRTGLFSLGKHTTDLYIHDAVIWTFEYSQLTHSILSAFSNLRIDLFFFKLLGFPTFIGIVIALLIPQILMLRKLYLNENYNLTKSDI